MPSQNIKGRDIQGLLPALDRRKVEGPHVIEGRNFIFDIDGPKSIFGGDYPMIDSFSDPLYVHSFRVAGRYFILTNFGVLCVDGTTRLLFPIHQLASEVSATPFQWTEASINRQHFFAHPAVGVIYYDELLDQWFSHPSASLPVNPKAVAESFGRLVVLGESAVVWSAIDDGLDLDSDLATGAGAQLTALVGGDTIMVTEYEFGFLTFTTRGIMKSEITGTETVYRHRVLSRDFILLNSFCVVRVDDAEVVFLTKTGFYQTVGDVPVRWQPIISEFLIDALRIFVNEQNLSPENLHMEWIQDFQILTLSFQSQPGDPYTFAYAFHRPTEKLGHFSENHYGFMKLEFVGGPDAGIFWGYIDENGRFFRWQGVSNREVFPSDFFSDLYKPTVQRPAQWDATNSRWIFPTVMHLASEDESALAGEIMGLYNSSQKAISPVTEGLDAFVHIGMFRFEEQTYADELSEVTKIVIGTEDSGDLDAVNEDWNIGSFRGDQDWNNIPLAGEEDWGVNVKDIEDFELQVAGTNDGFDDFIRVAAPDRVLHLPGAQHYHFTTVGIWHIFEVNAVTVGQSFHLKYFEVTGNLAGRL